MKKVLKKSILYIVLSVLFWIGVEYITVWHSQLENWLSLMPYILIEYLTIILLFYYLFFVRKLAEKKIFIIMVIVMYVFELLWKNVLLCNIVWAVPASFLLISIWGFLTFIPFWIVNQSLKERKVQVIYFLLWIPGGFVLSLCI